MIDKNISKRVLTVGTDYKNPKGGIAQVIYSYHKHILADGLFVVNSSVKGRKLLQFISGLTSMIWFFLRDRNIRIVHIHTASYISFWRSSVFLLAARCFGRKTIIHVHGGSFKEFYRQYPKSVKKILSKRDSVVALTESWKEFFEKEVGLANVTVVYNVVEPPVLMEKRPDDGAIHALFLGQICKEKGIYDLLQAISTHRDILHGKFRLHIGGIGETERLMDEIDKQHLEEIVAFEGWIDGQRKEELLNLCQVFLLPSYVEGLPISILEAMTYGEVVVASRVGGIPEIIDEQIGQLIDPGNVDELGKTLTQLVKLTPETLKEKGQRAMQAVEANLPQNIEKELISIYETLLR